MLGAVAPVGPHQVAHGNPDARLQIHDLAQYPGQQVTLVVAPVPAPAPVHGDGHQGIESDCEIAGLMLARMRVARVEEMHLDLGHVGIYRNLVREFKIGERAELLLHDALQRKAGDEVKALARDLKLTASHGDILAELATLNGDTEVLPEARRLLTTRVSGVSACLDELEALATAVKLRHGDIPIHFDLAELRGYHYHTGVVFSALVPGVGKDIARGGRYDEIGNVFGRARPATGFSTDLKQLLRLGQVGSEYSVTTPVYAPWSENEGLLRHIAELRGKGEAVIMLLPGETPTLSGRGVVRELKLIDQQWQVVESKVAVTPAAGGSTDRV